MNRPVCTACNRRPCAVNYKKDDKTYYRSKCDTCIRTGRKQKPPQPRWLVNGYVKKKVCDLCNFKARYATQTLVFHIDGNLNNNRLVNLRTVCLNCAEAIKKSDDLPWTPGDLEQDL